ncbi:hypothetical protein M427DRAFT_139760 [Gonapodya prolifera JEL478]|uniref:SH3 domain-containing protein n=1 Tax=Gonapodya prolifera (strain JEL478) TaxID=1344416 RepID=A0A139A0B9_GONPJ|nr:hypothetical protein M427DRAFT_139760 [Gonapodya prolifera JEL478]|eukprot:KXS10227.1 hypothetical protein M427DRAFT_139760 [Gonapodya prolifera JEL478]
MDANSSTTTATPESNARLIGGAVGGSLGALGVLVGAIFYLRRKRARHSKDDPEERKTLPTAPPSRSPSTSPPQYSFVVPRKLTRLFSKSSFEPSVRKSSDNRNTFPSLQSSFSDNSPPSALVTPRIVIPSVADVTSLELPPPSHRGLPWSTQANVGTVVVSSENLDSLAPIPRIELENTLSNGNGQNEPNCIHVESANPPANHWFYSYAAELSKMDPNSTVASAPYAGEPLFFLVPFTPSQPDELWVAPGNEVAIATVFRDGWASGKNLSTGQFGYFPVDILNLEPIVPDLYRINFGTPGPSTIALFAPAPRSVSLYPHSREMGTALQFASSKPVVDVRGPGIDSNLLRSGMFSDTGTSFASDIFAQDGRSGDCILNDGVSVI